MAVADFAAEWFETELLRAVVCARGICGTLRRPLVGGHHREPAAAGRGAPAATAPARPRSCAAASGALAQALAAPRRRLRRRDPHRRRGGAHHCAGRTRHRRRPARAARRSRRARWSPASTPSARSCACSTPPLLDPDDLRRHPQLPPAGHGLEGQPRAVRRCPPSRPSGGGRDALLGGRIHIGAEVDDLERAFDDAKYGGISQRPYLDVTIPSLSDPSLAPAGKHVLSAYVQYTPYRLREGDWDTRRDEVADAVLRMLEEHAPGHRALVVGRQVLTPADLERRYGLTGGHPVHGEPSLDQLFVTRPAAGLGALSRPARRTVPVQRGHPSGRRRHRRSRAQRRAGDPEGPGLVSTGSEVNHDGGFDFRGE